MYARSSSDSCETIKIACAADNDMFIKFGSDTTLVQQEMIDLLNLLGPLFSSPPLKIKFLLVETYIAAPNEIVADSETDLSVILSSFRTFGQTNFTNPFGVATLWITRNAQMGGNYGTDGVAYIGGACTFSRYIAIEHISPGTITESHQAKLWAHELGHIFGCSHAPQANSNIMAPLVSPSANTWTPTNISDILAKKNTANCLIPCNVYAHFSANDTAICAGTNVAYTDSSYGEPTSFAWSFPGGTPTSSTSQNPTVQYNSSGNYNATLIISSMTDTDTLIINNYINVNALPSVVYNLDTTLCLSDPPYNIDSASPGGGIYSGSGVSGDLFDPSIAGIGTHIITYNYVDPISTCMNSDTASIIVENCTAGLSVIKNNEFDLFPNPTHGLINISTSAQGLNFISVYDVLGQNITKRIKISKLSKYRMTMDFSTLSSGVYFIRTKTSTLKVYKQ